MDWHFNDDPPYFPWVDFQNGTRQFYATWERPHLVFDEGQTPTHLVTAVSAYWGDNATYGPTPCEKCDKRAGSEHSCVVCKTSAGIDYDFTLVSKLNIT